MTTAEPKGIERIPADSWEQWWDHTSRYQWAGSLVQPGDEVNDIACGVGYGWTFLKHAAKYRGWDKPGVPRPDKFGGEFYGCDLDDPAWYPEHHADVTTCFETIEHVRDPVRLARVICETTRRAIFLSVPLYPHEENPYHLTTFTVPEVPLLFAGFRVAFDRPQTEARGHLWLFERDAG